MDKFALEVLLGSIAYVCFGVGYSLHDDDSPSELLESVIEEDPGADAMNAFMPGVLRFLTAAVWTVFMLVWPVYLVLDIAAWVWDGVVWVWDHTLGLLWDRPFEAEEEKEEES